MNKNIPQFSPQQMQQLASSPAAQELLAILQKEHSAAMHSAVSSAQSGDMEAVKRSMAALMSDPKAKALLKKLQEEQHG